MTLLWNLKLNEKRQSVGAHIFWILIRVKGAGTSILPFMRPVGSLAQWLWCCLMTGNTRPYCLLTRLGVGAFQWLDLGASVSQKFVEVSQKGGLLDSGQVPDILVPNSCSPTKRSAAISSNNDKYEELTGKRTDLLINLIHDVNIRGSSRAQQCLDMNLESCLLETTEHRGMKRLRNSVQLNEISFKLLW